MPRGVPTQQSYEERRVNEERRQLQMALDSYRRMKAEAIQHLINFKTTKSPRDLQGAREAIELAEHARTVAARYEHWLPALPAIPTVSRRAS